MFKVFGELEKAASTGEEPTKQDKKPNIKANCPSCKQDSSFAHIGYNNSVYMLMTDNALKILGGETAFLAKYGKDHELYDCLSCHSSQTSSSLNLKP